MLIAVALHATAVPINGVAKFSGSGSGMQSGGISTLTFNNPMTFTLGIGDYSAIPSRTAATFAPISWTGSGVSATLTSPNDPEWTIVSGGTTYRFSLTSLITATFRSNQMQRTAPTRMHSLGVVKSSDLQPRVLPDAVANLVSR